MVCSNFCSSTTRSTARSVTRAANVPLQDQTLAFGPGGTRFVEEKRHYEKPIEISPLVDSIASVAFFATAVHVFQRRCRRPAHPLPRPRERNAGQHFSRPPFCFVLQRQYRADCPVVRLLLRLIASKLVLGTSSKSRALARRVRSVVASRCNLVVTNHSLHWS